MSQILLMNLPNPILPTVILVETKIVGFADVTNSAGEWINEHNYAKIALEYLQKTKCKVYYLAERHANVAPVPL